MARGPLLGLLAAALFGLSAPLAKILLGQVEPLVLAGLLYLGAGLGLSLLAVVPGRPAGAREAPLRRADLGLLAGVIVFGGMLGPLLLLVGLLRVSAVAGSLLLNLEAPLTMGLAALLFREHLGARVLASAALIVGGAAVLGYGPGELRLDPLGALAIAGACLAWALDNNLTARLSLRDPVAIVRIKGLGAGACSLAIALSAGQPLPAATAIAAALALGLASYGASVVLHVRAMRALGAARQAALFATAPFVGALAAVPLLGERLGLPDLAAGALMAAGVVVLLRERHSHPHTHEELEHEHLHWHDEHHRHEHAPGMSRDEPHSHWHRHPPLTHDHPHLPDLHHRHGHREQLRGSNKNSRP